MKKFILFIGLGLIMATFNSCKKAGCTDITATNYNSNAKKEDGTCTYSEKLIFWQSYATSQAIQQAGITGLAIYVDGNLVGTCLASNYWTGTPSCSQSGNASATIEMGTNTTKTVNVQIKDQNGVVLVSNTVLVVAGTCSIYEM